ncbi:MAG: hypothetical protein C4288_10140 [Leptolyngbya sp. ERB_1_1]
MRSHRIDFKEAFFENATLRIPANQAGSVIQLETEVLEWYRSQSADYKTLIRSVLRRHMEENRTQQAG